MKKLITIAMVATLLLSCSFGTRQGVFVALQVADLGTTEYGVRNGLSEGNPFAPTKTWGRVVAKFAYTGGMLYLFDAIHKENKNLANVLQCVICGVFGAVVINNIYQIRRAEK